MPQKTRRQRLKLYALGVRSKIRQANYALTQLSKFAPLSDSDTTATNEYEVHARVGFYCDSFWAFLYSSLDVLAQVINQALKLGIPEKIVSFKSVARALKLNHKGTPIEKKVNVCLKSTAFKNLDKYRNCSTHRREIYFLEKTEVVKEIAGYNTTVTTGVESVTRLICDDPLVLTPKVEQKRKIPDYLETTEKRIIKQVEVIIKNLNPTK